MKNKSIELLKKSLIENMDNFKDVIVFGSKGQVCIAGEEIEVLGTLGCIFLKLKEAGVAEEHIKLALSSTYEHESESDKEIDSLEELLKKVLKNIEILKES